MFADYLKELSGGLTKTASDGPKDAVSVLLERKEAEAVKEAIAPGIIGYMAQGNPDATPRSGFWRGMGGGIAGGAAGVGVGRLLKSNRVAAGLGTLGSLAGGYVGGRTAKATPAETQRYEAQQGRRKEAALMGMTYDPNNKAVKAMQAQHGENWKGVLAKKRGISAQNIQPVKTASGCSPKKPKNKLSAMVKKAAPGEQPGLLQRMGALGAARRSKELGMPGEYVRPTMALGANRAGGGALRGGLAGGGLGAAAGTALGLGAGALLRAPKAGAAIGGLLGAGGGAAVGTGLGATRAGGQAAEDVRERLEDKMWERAMVNRQRAQAQRRAIHNYVMQRQQRQQRMKTAAFNPFKNPMVTGGLAGAAGGAGIGVLSSGDKSNKGLLRSGLIGAAVGGSIGTLAGSLSQGVKAMDAATAANSKKMKNLLLEAQLKGIKDGRAQIIEAMRPSVARYEQMIKDLGGKIA